MALMKSGMLWRQSSILRRWKRNWFDLWVDGNLLYYENESRRDYENRIRLKHKCTSVKAGLECTGVDPPEGKPQECLVLVYLKDGSKLVLCADSEDEALAWKLALLEARANPVYMYDPYDDAYHTIPLDSHNAVYISPAYPGYGYGGTHHVLVHSDPCEGVGTQVALGLLAGMATGAALRSLMWMPFWFC